MKVQDITNKYKTQYFATVEDAESEAEAIENLVWQTDEGKLRIRAIEDKYLVAFTSGEYETKCNIPKKETDQTEFLKNNNSTLDCKYYITYLNKSNKKKRELYYQITLKLGKKPVITSDDLPSSVKSNIKANTKNVGADFEVGESDKENIEEIEIAALDLASTTADVASKALANSNVVKAAAAPLATVASAISIAQTAQQLTAIAVQKMTTEITSYATDQVSKMLMIDFGKIASLTTSYMTQNLASKGILMDQLTKESDDTDEQDEKSNKEEQAKEQSKFAQRAGEIKKSVDEALEKYTKGIESVTNNIEKGEEWLINNMNKYVNTAIDESKKFLAAQTNELDKQKNDWYTAIAQKTGKALATKTNAKLLAVTKTALDKVKQAKQKAIALAKSLIAKLKLKIMGMLGG